MIKLTLIICCFDVVKQFRLNYIRIFNFNLRANVSQREKGDNFDRTKYKVENKIMKQR